MPTYEIRFHEATRIDFKKNVHNFTVTKKFCILLMTLLSFRGRVNAINLNRYGELFKK